MMFSNMSPPPDPHDEALERDLHASRGLESAPEHVVQRAFAVWRPRAPAPPALRRLLATLVFDSSLAPALGVRAGTARQRQLLFNADGLDIDLRIDTLPDGRFVLSGQVLGPEGDVRLTLECAGAAQHCTPDALADFRFEPVPAGPCRLRLQHGTDEIELPPLTLQA
jgi:hypothetical protein